MAEYEIEQDIAAAPDRVWSILTDKSRLAGGELGITRIEGHITAGSRIKVWSDASPGRAFLLRVGAFEPPWHMTWVGGMPLGLFKGVRTFSLAPYEGGVRFRMHETFTGLLAPMISSTMPDLSPSFRRFAAGLKMLSETQP